MYRALCGLTALLVLAGCAGGGRGPAERPPSGFDGAARLVDQGQYSQALTILRCVAKQGQGFEIAQYLAGHSALALAHAETTPVILRDEMRVEGLDRLTLASNAGWPAAQAELAEAFAEIGTDEALREAAYWVQIYRSNSRERAYGLNRLDGSVEEAIESQLGEAGMAATGQRVAQFNITPLARETITPECAQHVRSGRGGGPGNGAREGRRPTGGGRGGGGGAGGGRRDGGD